MGHSCRCSKHPVLTLLVASVVGSVVGIGVHLWFEPYVSAIVVAAGAIAGLILARVLGDSLVLGLAVGCGVMLLALGVRALASIWATLQRPPSFASSRVWFSR